jgi:hypothetical protein
MKALELGGLLALGLLFRFLRRTHECELSAFTRRLHFKAKGHGVLVDNLVGDFHLHFLTIGIGLSKIENRDAILGRPSSTAEFPL